MRQRRTIGLIGTGQVGAAAAYALFQHQVASEIILVDVDHRRAEGEAMDLMHAQTLVGRLTVRAGTYADLATAQVVAISAGVGQKPGESRLALLNRNAAIFRDIAQHLDQHTPDAILIIATNPVDIMTYVMQHLSRRPPHHIIGTGTMLDTTRFRALLGEYYGVSPRSVHAYILGEHGDSEVPIWSNASIGGVPLLNHTVVGKPFDRATMEKLFKQVQHAAYDIIERKGYTNTAIGLVITRLMEAILEDQKSVLPVSVRLAGEYDLADVCLSLPCIVGIDGIEARVLPELNAEELEGLRRSATILQANLKELELR
jgi:L-lactate dehydrogenase